MLKNYAKIALRNLFRHSGYSLINILGLAIGMGCCILILLLVQSELGFDTHHEEANRIYRVLREVRTTGASSNTYTGTSGALSGALLETYPEVEQAARMMNFGVYVRYEVGDRGFRQNFDTVDPSVFEIFTFPFAKGDPEAALDRPRTAVLSEEMAVKFFGDEDPIGKTITVEFRYFAGEYTIMGVLRNTRRASSIQIDFLTTTVAEFPRRMWEEWSLASTFFPAQNYILLRKDADPATQERKLVSFAEKKLGPELAALNTYYLQPFTRIHLYSTSDYGISSTTDISTIKHLHQHRRFHSAASLHQFHESRHGPFRESSARSRAPQGIGCSPPPDRRTIPGRIHSILDSRNVLCRAFRLARDA